MHVGYIKSQHMDDKTTLKGAWSESRDPFCNFAPIIFVISEASHKFRALIDTESYECKHDILLLKRLCSESRDLFNFWEISDTISETVQYRDIVAIKDY